MSKSKWQWLQLFAGEGAGASGGEGGGDGAGTGVNNPDAGDQALRDLGVPERLLAKRAKRAPAKLPDGAVRTTTVEQQAEAQSQTATDNEHQEVEKETEKEGAETPKRLTWDEIMADPEYNKKMQATMKARLKTAGIAEENMAAMEEALGLLATQHGLDPTNIDYTALAKKIVDRNSVIEDRAIARGLTYGEAEKEVDDLLAQAKQAKEQRIEEHNIQEQKFQQHFEKLERQGEELKKKFPQFDLRQEMKNPKFVQLVNPNSLMSLEDAYYAVHRQEIMSAGMQMATQKAVEQTTNAIRSGANRPVESGSSGQSPSVTSFDYSKASKAEREALKKAIFAAKARGEKLYPGG